MWCNASFPLISQEVAGRRSDIGARADTILGVSWSAKQYVIFEDERTRPVRDLLSALPAIEARTAMDLGCGPGNSTELLAARFPNAAVTCGTALPRSAPTSWRPRASRNTARST